MKNLFLLAIILLFMTSCGDKQPQKDIKNQDNITKIDTISYELKTVSKTHGKCDEPTKHCAKAIIEYPFFTKGTNATVLNQMNAIIEKGLKENAPTIEASLDSFINEAKAYYKDFPDALAGHALELHQEVGLNGPDFMSIEDNVYVYMGGAHGNYATTHYNFDLHTGKLLGLDDLLKKDYSTALLALIEEELKKEFLEEGMTKLSDAGFFLENDQLSLPQSFAIKKDGLQFVYNPYEIAPYAMGQQIVHIPYQKMSHLIKESKLMNSKK
jgi:hypothetical protein